MRTSIIKLQMSKITTIAKILEDRFPKPSKIVIKDVNNDEKHFDISIESALFKGKSLVEQHQFVYEPLKTLIDTNDIHALQIKTHTLDEQ